MNIAYDERVLFINDNEILSYNNGYLLYRKGKNFKQKVFIGGLLSKVKLIERLLRYEPRCAAKINDENFIVSFKGTILKYSVKENTIHVEHKFNRGMNNPLTFLSMQQKDKNNIDIYYGEYIWNGKKGPVSIYKRTGDKWYEIYEFPANTITHIHNIVFDRYRKSFVILTGDMNSESGLWCADLNFENVRPILLGKQQYRACVAFPVEDGIVYATDTPLEKNYIYHIYMDNYYNITGIEKEFELYGPCIYGAEHNGKMYFSNSVEPDSTLSKWQYRFTYKLGKGVLDSNVHIIQREGNGRYTKIATIKKDIWPMWLFQFGNVLFPQNESKELYGVLQATVLGHGKTVKF